MATNNELESIRKQVIEIKTKLEDLARKYKRAIKFLNNIGCPCPKCKYEPNCEYAYDIYNINGECLAEK